jgi:hypothetical protein
MDKQSGVFRSLLVLYICISLVFTPFLMSGGELFAQEVDLEKTLKQAEEKYTEGRFDETIALITVCLDQPTITPEQKQQAYRLMGLTYIAKDYLAEAKNAIESLLLLVPNYKPDPIYDPPPFINLVEEVQREVVAVQAKSDEKKDTSKMYWYIGGGVAAAAILTVVLLSGGDEEAAEEDLPGPPSMP